MSTLNLDFDDKVALASQVINKLFHNKNKSLNDERAGQIVEEVLNEGSYDTDSVSSDLEDINDSSIMDCIMNNITQKLRIQWTQQMSQLFYKKLNDIFTNGVTDYKQLTSEPNEVTEDKDSKELEDDPTPNQTRRAMRQFTELNSNELANRPISERNLEKQTRNQLLDTMNNNRFFEIVQQAISITNQQTNKSLTQINEKEVMIFFKSKQGINKDIFKQLNKKIFFDKVQKHMNMSKGSGYRLFKQITDLIKPRNLTDLNDNEFYFIVKQGINNINEENKEKSSGFKVINPQEIIKYFKRVGLNGSQFISSFNKKAFQSKIEDRLSKGTTNRLHKYLTQICDIEKTLSLMTDSINIDIDIDMSRSCKQIGTLEECNMMQLRYALLFVIIEFNKEKEKEKEKQISNRDNVIEFLCYQQQLDGYKISKMSASQFAYLLYDTLQVVHNPGKKILIGLKDYNFHDMPTQNIDLHLPFVLIKSIREQQEKMDSKSNKLNENDIIYTMQYRKYSQVEDRKEFVDFLKNKCRILRGPSIKLRNCIIRNVQSIITKNKFRITIPSNKYVKYIQTNPQNEYNIFDIIKKYQNITQCDMNDLRLIIECCIEFINRENIIINNCNEIWKSLNHRINKPKRIVKQKQIKCLEECDNKLFVKVIKDCIDKLINNGTFKSNSDNSLGCTDNKIKLLNYFQKSDITGCNFNEMFPKKARFAKKITEACFTKKQKGIKTDMMKIYIEITQYDYTKLSIPIEVNDDSKQNQQEQEMDGKIFINNFKSKELFVEYINKNTSIQNKNVLMYLYEFITNGFFEWNKSQNNNHFMNWLYLFANKKYKIKMFVKSKNKLKKLSGYKLVNDSQFGCDMFINILEESKIFDVQNSKIAMNIYNDLMEYNLRLKRIKQISKCNHNELVYILRKYILPQFNQNQLNKNKTPNFTLNIDTIIESLNKNTDLTGKDFKKGKRKPTAEKLHSYNKNLKLGPLRKLSTNINNYPIII